MFYDSEQYELITDIEADELLSQLPLDTMRENISEQIADPLYTNINYLDIIFEKIY